MKLVLLLTLKMSQAKIKTYFKETTMRQFLATPFIALAHLLCWIINKIDSEPFVCFSTREAVEITDENVDEIIKEMQDEQTKG